MFLLVNAVDRPAFDDDSLWDQLTSALNIGRAASDVYERLSTPTEAALCESLLQHKWDVLHIFTHPQEREGSVYSTVGLLSADRRARYIQANYFASLLCGQPSLKLVVLQSLGHETEPFRNVAAALVAKGIPGVLAAPLFRGREEQVFLHKLYSGLLSGLSLNELAQEYARLSASDAGNLFARVFVQGSSMGSAIIPVDERTPTSPVESVAPGAEILPRSNPATSVGPAPGNAENPPGLPTSELDRKRKSGIFDVFLSHNSNDKDEVESLGQKLKEAGILPWLAQWELAPGEYWQESLFDRIGKVRSAAICIGASGLSFWQKREIETCWIESEERKIPVIAVVLESAPERLEIPNYLKTLHRVDFRKKDPRPLERLIWGINRSKPSS